MKAATKPSNIMFWFQYLSLSMFLLLVVFSGQGGQVEGLSSSKASISSNNKNSNLRRTPIGRITLLDRSKLDTQPDSQFYSHANMVTHTDDAFIDQLQQVYRDVLPMRSSSRSTNNNNNNNNDDDDEHPPLRILDLMSSHVSHLPRELVSNEPSSRLGVVVVVDVHGMNAMELEENPARAQTGGQSLVRDLNANPSLVGLCDNDNDDDKDTLYDVVLCCVGIQYLQEAEAVLAEVARVLRPGSGRILISFTNRFFYPKAIQGWMDRGMQERGRLVQDYLRAAGGYTNIEILGDGTSVWKQLASLGGLGGDPFVVVSATRTKEE